MARTVTWDVESTRYFLELLGARFSRSRGSIPSTAVYESIVEKLNERYGPGAYNLESLRSKFQRMKKPYKIYCRVQTNTGLGWDEETQTVNCPEESIKDFAKGDKEAEKICREGLPNADLYRAVYSRCTATGFMATASGGRPPQSSQMLFVESDEDWEAEPDLSEMAGPHSGDKRPSSSKQPPRQSRKKNGKMQSVDETFQNIASIMTDRFGLGDHHVDGPPKDPYDFSACLAILANMGLDHETQYRAFEFLRKQDKEMKKAFATWEPEFRKFWLTKTLGSE